MEYVPTRTRPLALVARQIWATSEPGPTFTTECYAYNIPAGVIFVNDTTMYVLNQSAIMQPDCGQNITGPPNQTIPDNAIVDFRDPYFASTSPVAFVLAVCLTISWVLFLMLLLTPTTYLGGAMSSGQKHREGLPVYGIGNRPWFQKVASLFVAISLLIATVVTFSTAEMQYADGYQDSTLLTLSTLSSMQIRTVRFVSTIFEWLAQAQTALRLFNRHRERVAIKWCALSLILLEIIFGIINNFTRLGTDGHLNSRHYTNAFPALQYLFEIALSLMYLAVVVYYSLTKRRYAFYHSEMWNITVVAFLALTAVLLPIVFFILDLAIMNVSSWGDYVRWVGAAAASVIVWEWVDRIESLERFERKDGILGREIFEGDEILDGDSGPGGPYERRARRRRADTSGSGSGSTTMINSSSGDRLSRLESGVESTGASTAGLIKKRSGVSRERFPRVNRQVLAKIATLRNFARQHNKPNPSQAVELHPVKRAVRRRRRREAEFQAHATTSTPDPATLAQSSVSPVSRSDTNSASTVYRIVHHRNSPSSTPGISEILYPLGEMMNVPTPLQDHGHNTDAPRRTRITFDLSNLNPFGRPSESRPMAPNSAPKAPTTGVEALAEEGHAASGDKVSVSGFLSRLRHGKQREILPPLVIPWRGDDPEQHQDMDLEAGHTEHGTLHDIEEDEDDYNDEEEGDEGEEEEEPGAGREFSARQAPTHSRNVSQTESGQIAAGNTVHAIDWPEQARRSPIRPYNTTPGEQRPP